MLNIIPKETANELILSSQHVKAKHANAMGYVFKIPDLEQAITV